MERETLINAVREHPIIWDYTSKDHKNLAKVDQAWESIASELGISEKEAKCKWKNLRDSWVKKKKAMEEGPSGSAAKKVEAWPLWELMSFLKDVGTNARTMENIAMDDEELAELQPRKKKPKTAKEDDHYLEALKDATWTLKGMQSDENEEDDNFGRTLLAGFRKLSPARKLRARTELLAVLTRYELEEITDVNNRQPSSPPQARLARPWLSTPRKTLASPRRRASHTTPP